MAENARRTADGKDKGFPTHIPFGTTTFYTSAGDDLIAPEVGAGVVSEFKLLSTDVSVQKELEFLEDVYIKDGSIITRNAPFGSSISIEIVHPTAGVVQTFVNNVSLLDSHTVPFTTEGMSLTPLGLRVRTIVFNSDGLGDHEAATAFYVVTALKCYRATTV